MSAAPLSRSQATSRHVTPPVLPSMIHAALAVPGAAAVTESGPSSPVAPSLYGASTTRKPGATALIVASATAWLPAPSMSWTCGGCSAVNAGSTKVGSPAVVVAAIASPPSGRSTVRRLPASA